ncbi:hypothetical protein LUW77_00850 [Streptomyces radiopugnans]|nr:hypothetical protein LUW77_00850 [Streptomyces radiopugnans]
MTVLITAAGAVAEEPRPAEGDGTGAAAWFDPAAHLGKRGWKYLSPATRYLLAAGNQALGRRHDEPPLTGALAERFGVVTGTQYAIAGVHRRMDDTLATTGVQGISPAEVPAFSMNTPGSQLAISTGARAFSVTLTNPVTAGLEAVQFAVTALRTGRADRVVAAATDQVSARGRRTRPVRRRRRCRAVERPGSGLRRGRRRPRRYHRRDLPVRPPGRRRRPGPGCPRRELRTGRRSGGWGAERAPGGQRTGRRRGVRRCGPRRRRRVHRQGGRLGAGSRRGGQPGTALRGLGPAGADRARPDRGDRTGGVGLGIRASHRDSPRRPRSIRIPLNS